MKFIQDIEKFNGMYGLPKPEHPTLEAVGNPLTRLDNFKNILLEEVEEVDEIIASLGENALLEYPISEEAKLEALTNLSDWLGDIIVYAASEMRRFGLPIEGVLDAIMESNFSKLAADGTVIMDDRGKVMKGPGYWKPEPKIKELLQNS